MTTTVLPRFAALASLTQLLCSCSATAPSLHPAPRANKVLGLQAAAEETDSETQIIVQAAKWPGDEQIAQEQTSLRVTVNNRGGDPLRIEYDDFVLQGASRAYTARPTKTLPTGEVMAWAIPEGVVLPGGSTSGYLCFEPVDDDESDVQFRAHIDSAESGMEVVNVSIPFMVLD